jgi:hypothetical protein
VNSDGANHSAFEGLDDLGAAAGNDLSGCRSQDIDVSKGQDRIVIMHPDGMAAMPEIPQSLSSVHSFEQDTQYPGRNNRSGSGPAQAARRIQDAAAEALPAIQLSA